MQLTVKTLQQKTFTIDVEPSHTILQVKEIIQQKQDFAVNQQKLIHSGKILADTVTVADANIKETDFLVVMVTKPKTPAASSSTTQQPTPTTSAPAPAPAPAPEPAPAPAPAVAQEAPAPVPANEPTPAPAATATESAAPTATTFDASTLATGSAYQSAVNNLVEMGFPKADVERAMRAAFNNPDRAAEYLMTGIPTNLEGMGGGAPRPATADAAPATPVAAAGTAPAATAAATQAAAAAGAPGYVNLFDAGAQQLRTQGAQGGNTPTVPVPETLTNLRNSPQFQQLRALVRNQPALLEQILAQIATTQPQLFNLITQNQDAFLQLLNEEGAGDEEMAWEDFAEEGDGAADAPGGAALGGGPRPNTRVIQVTPEEDAAITRLAALGFDRQQAAEAFFACDKNEELAANFLFDSMNQDDF